MEDNRSKEKILRSQFLAWCNRKGYKPVRSVHCLSAIGDVAMYKCKGRFTIEVATELEPSQTLVKAAGSTHGYSYPVLNKKLEAAAEFLGEENDSR